jgi:TPR repeat protein
MTRLSLPFISVAHARRGYWIFALLGSVLFVPVVLFHPHSAAAQQSRGLDPLSQSAAVGVPNGNYYALVIGINEYQPPLARLKTAVNDAQSMGNLLHDRYGFHVTYILDQNATRFNILNALAKFRNSLGENDNLLIYYAGHGFSDRDAQKAYWLPVDADSATSPNRIIADDLTTGVRVLPSRHVLIVSDSCYSGALTRDADVPVPTDGQAAFINRMLRSRSRTLMASGGDEPVADGGSNGHSVFANAVLGALGNSSQSMFTASDLFYGSVRQQVAGKSEQLPQYSIIRNSDHDEGDFVFARVAANIPPTASAAVPAAEVRSLPPAEAPLTPLAMSIRGEELAMKKRYADANPLLTAACNGGQASSCTILGWLYQGGLGVSRDESQAVVLFRKACDGGSMRGCSDLGSMHEYGRGVGKDEDEAVELYRKACNGSDPSGCENLGNMYASGKGIGQDDGKAAEFFQKSCAAGLAPGCTSIAISYVNGKGVAKDSTQAIALFKKACDGGDFRGCFDLGSMYFDGMGVAKDLAQASVLIQKACEGGYAIACNNLGHLYQIGNGAPKDDAQALNWFKRSCDGGYPAGCTNLGEVYGKGMGVAKDDAQAAGLYSKGCEGGDPQGCNFLAVLYFNGSGVPKDAAQSAALARKACDSGVPRGCLNLGLLYESGTGVTKDLGQAEELYHKACEGGFEDGCKNLKRLKP